MAKHTLVQLVDDISGDTITDGSGRTVRFSHDGVDYEIDLTSKNADKFASVLEPYVKAARRVSGRRGSRGSSGASKGGSSETGAIREWAQSQGIKVASRGRIPAELQEQYRNRNK